MTTRIPAESFPPGEFLREELEAREWTQADLEEILGRSATEVSEMVNGKRRVTPPWARDLGAALGTSAEFWMGLESYYQL